MFILHSFPLRRFLLPLTALLLTAGALRGQMISPVLSPHAAEVEAALEKAFEFFLQHQRPNGSFPGEYGESAGIVGLAGMSFLAAGHTPGADRYGQFINDCIDYVLEQQNEDGYILANRGKDRGMYSHHIATLFLAEVSGMLDPQRDAKVREALEKATRVILSSQEAKKRSGHEGGWRYSPGANDSDVSVSGWALMALKAARLNGALVPEKNIDQAVKYLLGNQVDNGGFAYQNKRGERVSLTGLSILCLNLTGHHDSAEVAKAHQYLRENYRKIPREQFSLYGLYYVTQAAFQLGGSTWEDVGDWVYKRYLPLQSEDGSWSGNVGGSNGSEKNTPAYSTAMVVLSLTVPYRQLPIYQRDETVDE